MNDADEAHDTARVERALGRVAHATPVEREAVHALAAVAPWPEELGRRLIASAQARVAALVDPVGSIPARVLLRIRAVAARIDAFIGAGELVESAQVRGDTPSGVLVRHTFGPGHASTHVDLAGDRFVVMIDLGTDAAERHTRVSLFRDGRELASEHVRKGRWLLPTLSAGAYRLRSTAKDGGVAELDLVLERPAD